MSLPSVGPQNGFRSRLGNATRIDELVLGHADAEILFNDGDTICLVGGTLGKETGQKLNADKLVLRHANVEVLCDDSAANLIGDNLDMEVGQNLDIVNEPIIGHVDA